MQFDSNFIRLVTKSEPGAVRPIGYSQVRRELLVSASSKLVVPSVTLGICSGIFDMDSAPVVCAFSVSLAGRRLRSSLRILG